MPVLSSTFATFNKKIMRVIGYENKPIYRERKKVVFVFILIDQVNVNISTQM